MRRRPPTLATGHKVSVVAGNEGADPGKVALHDSFEQLLKLARSGLRHAGFVDDAGLADVSLTRGESFLLAEVLNQAPVRLSDLATSMGLDRSIASRQTESLVRAGFVERRPDPTDGRAALLAPTRTGRSVVTRLRGQRKRWLDRVVSTLDPHDVDALTLLLPRLVVAIEQAEAGAEQVP